MSGKCCCLGFSLSFYGFSQGAPVNPFSLKKTAAYILLVWRTWKLLTKKSQFLHINVHIK